MGMLLCTLSPDSSKQGGGFAVACYGARCRNSEAPFTFVVNFMVPGPPFRNLVMSWASHSVPPGWTHAFASASGAHFCCGSTPSIQPVISGQLMSYLTTSLTLCEALCAPLSHHDMSWRPSKSGIRLRSMTIESLKPPSCRNISLSVSKLMGALGTEWHVLLQESQRSRPVRR